jgi:hypothetical protein
MKKITIITFIFLKIPLYAQVGIGTTTPHAAIEVSSSNDGFLLPRVALKNKNTCSILTPTVSEIVYNTATSGEAHNKVKPGFYFWNGTEWTELGHNSNIRNWGATGNCGSTATTDFAGTTSNEDFNFKRFNIKAGSLGATTTAFGVNALVANTAVGNTAFGVNALAGNTHATGNTAFGYHTLRRNAGAGNTNNTAFGFEALLFNNSATTTLAKNNTAIGARTLRANTTGYNNTAVGLNSQTNNTIGIFNTGVGTGTLLSNSTGGFNVALGTAALRQNTIGNNNNGIGRGSLELNTTGNNNTALGSNALNANTTGTDNVAVGFISITKNTTGSQNTAIGAFVLHNASVSNNNTVIGYRTLGNPSVSGSNNVVIGHESFTFLTTGSNNIGIGEGAEVPSSTASNQVRIGNTAVTCAAIQVPWTITSDRRWKSDIKDSNLGLNFIKKLNPVSYRRNNDKSRKLEYGFIAQELDQALHQSKVVNDGIVSKADDGMLSVRYNDLLAPMVKAIQQQQSIIKKLVTRIKELEKIKNSNIIKATVANN